MEDVARVTGIRVIASRSRAALVLKVALGVLGLFTPVLAHRYGDGLPALYVLALVCFPAGFFAIGRGLHGLTLRRAIATHDGGIVFAWAEDVSFAPWQRARVQRVSWGAFRGITSKHFTVNGVTTETLHVKTRDGAFEVPVEGFDRGADAIQRDVLDHLERLAPQPRAETSVYARACATRFAKPVTSEASPFAVVGTAALAALVIGAGAFVALSTSSAIAYGLAGIATALFGTLLAFTLRGFIEERVLALDADGLRIGSRFVRWASIRSVRRRVINGHTRGLDVTLEDGTRISLTQSYGISYDDIAAWIDPAVAR